MYRYVRVRGDFRQNPDQRLRMGIFSAEKWFLNEEFRVLHKPQIKIHIASPRAKAHHLESLCKLVIKRAPFAHIQGGLT